MRRARAKYQRACKPGSVPPLQAAATIPLGRHLHAGSSNQPGRRAETKPICRPYSVLLPVGFAVPLPLPVARCALAAPFHPCRARRRWRSALCGTFPGVTPAGRYPAPSFRGARTFLAVPKHPAAARPSGASALSRPPGVLATAAPTGYTGTRRRSCRRSARDGNAAGTRRPPPTCPTRRNRNVRAR